MHVLLAINPTSTNVWQFWDKNYTYFQHRLVESIRTEKGFRQQTVLNLGTLEIDESKFKTLANSIEAILNKFDWGGRFVSTKKEKKEKHQWNIPHGLKMLASTMKSPATNRKYSVYIIYQSKRYFNQRVMHLHISN